MIEITKQERFIAKTFEGLEDLLAEELRLIGAGDIQKITRGVAFSGDRKLLYESNYLCYTALRILVPIAEFNVETQDEFYNAVFDIPWDQYLSLHQTFAIAPVVFTEVFTNSHFAALRCKDAIADRMMKRFKRRPNVDTDDPDILVNLHISNNKVTISLDSSGSSLHLRGYRKKSSEAPLSEVLAAGMIKLAGWDGKTDFYDPMCGSGTLLIEAAMQAASIPAGKFREKFGFMNWSGFDRKLWNDIVQKAAKSESEPECRIIGSDISDRAIAASRVNIRTAGLSRYVKLRKQDIRESSPEGKEGIVITNPPYGERIKTEDISKLYSEIGDALKNNYTGFSAWLLTSDLEALKQVGLRTSKKIILYNGPLECRFANFELYKGSRKSSDNI